MNQCIVLVGVRGSGKSTVAKLLGKKLNLRVIDTDDENACALTASYSRAFRDRETAILKGISPDDRAVVATGGGAVLRKENRRHLKELGMVFYLEARVSVLYDRIGEDSDRPLLTSAKNMRGDLNNLHRQRASKYRAVADQVIHTSERRPSEVVEEIASIYRRQAAGPKSNDSLAEPVPS